MEAILQFFAETVFHSASRRARRRRAAAFAASLGLRFHAEGRPDRSDPAAGWLEELEMLGVPFVQPIADTFAGAYGGRHVIGFENPVWDKRKRRHLPYRFAAVRLARPVPDLLVATAAEASVSWWKPDARCLPIPVPGGADRKATAADPAFADGVLKALDDAALERSWTVRANWAVGWHRGHLRTRGVHDAGRGLRFLAAAAHACERS